MNKYKKIGDYVNLLKAQGLLANEATDKVDLNKEVKYISYNSKDVEIGTLFVCKGASFSVEYLKDAQGKGAFAYISETEFKEVEGLVCLKVNDIRKAMACVANVYFDRAWEKIKLTGFTGTKGKSSTAYYLKSILDEYLKEKGKDESGILSGIDVYDGKERFEAHLTTPETFELHRHLSNAAEAGLEYVTMEVSSQALKYHRTLGIEFDVACFMNIGEDHISGKEHENFEDYFQSKLKIFSQCNCACVNVDSDEIDRIMEAARIAPRCMSFGIEKNADIKAEDIVCRGNEISFFVNLEGKRERFELSMAGEFNVYNALAAISAAVVYNIPIENIRTGLKKARVSGRMEFFEDRETGRIAIVDYAHNIMSFEVLFAAMKKQFPERDIKIVFGCPGNKAISRRQELGRLAGKYAKMTYITEEDYGEESLELICDEIAKAVADSGGKYDIIYDRELAIAKALKEADETDIVLITGKGRETRQKRGREYIETPSDVEIVSKILS